MLSILDRMLEGAFTPLYALTLLIALWRYRRYYDTALKYFPILLFYTFLTELLGIIIRDSVNINLFLNEFYANNNFVIFNIYYIISFSFFLAIYYLYLNRPSHRKIVVGLMIFFSVTALVNSIYESFLTISQVYAYVAGGISMIACTSLYFIENKTDRKRWFNPRDLLSWISLGMLAFYLVYTPIKILKQYWLMIGEYHQPWSRRVHLTVLVFMYVSFIIGFLKMDRLTLKRRIEL